MSRVEMFAWLKDDVRQAEQAMGTFSRGNENFKHRESTGDRKDWVRQDINVVFKELIHKLLTQNWDKPYYWKPNSIGGVNGIVFYNRSYILNFFLLSDLKPCKSYNVDSERVRENLEYHEKIKVKTLGAAVVLIVLLQLPLLCYRSPSSPNTTMLHPLLPRPNLLPPLLGPTV